MKKLIAGFAFGLLVGIASTFAIESFQDHHQKPYTGQQLRAISTLSASDIEQLERGAGWGFAKPAELNAYPGPMHVLELAEELNLTISQVDTVTAVFQTMRERAVALGPEFIEAERQLDQAFKNETITPELIDAKTKYAALLRAQLRSVHLLAHLEITPLLTKEQLRQYAELRGYANGHTNHGTH